jgi:predicted nucleic acid-binding protein
LSLQFQKWKNFRYWSLFGRYAIVEIRPAIANRAMRLDKIHGLRCYDAVLFAAALTANDERISIDASALT